MTLVRIPPPYTSFNQIHTFHYGEIPFDLDVSPDGELISASFGEVNGKQSVRCGSATTSSRAMPDDPVATLVAAALDAGEVSPSRPTARRCSATSYYTGVSNVFRLRYRDAANMTSLSNASTGFFRPQLAARRLAVRL